MRCPHCNIRLTFLPEAAGRAMHCHACHKDFPAPITPIKPGTEQGDFAFGEKLGSGCISDVFIGTKKSTGERVRLKVFARRSTRNKTCMERFLLVAGDAQDCGAQPIPELIEAGKVCSHIYIATPLVEGQTIDQLVAAEGPVPEEDAFDLIERLITILDQLWHEHGHVHRSLSPGNILLTPNRELVLLDAGVDRNLLNEGPGDVESEDQSSYAAPELASKIGKPSCAADIYSLGAVFFYLITGTDPQPGEDSTAMVRRAGEEGEPMSVRAGRFVYKTVVEKPYERPKDWDFLRDILESLDTTTQMPMARREFKRVPKHRGAVVAVALVLLLVAAGFGVHSIGTNPPEKTWPEAAPAIIGVQILDTDGNVLRPLRDGDALSQRDLPTEIVILALPSANTQSIRFQLGKRKPIRRGPPYSLYGTLRGKPKPWKPTTGNHSFTAMPYSTEGDEDTPGRRLRIRFSIVK